MDTRSQWQRRALQLLRLIVVVTPSLFVVAIFITFLGILGWTLLADLRSDGNSTLVLIALIPYLAIAIWLGSAFLRFGVRLLPLASDGQRRPMLIVILVLALSILTAPYVVFATDLADSLELLSSGRPLSLGGEFDFKGLDELVALFTLIFGAWLLASLGVPLAVLLNRHVNPTNWRSLPYLLFLRRFSGLSNAIGIGPLVQGVPVNTRVVFLVGPRDNPRIWNPFMMAFSGIRLTMPFRAVPVCLQSTDESWENDIRTLAADAKAIAVDLTNASKSMQLERKIAEDSASPESVLWLHDHSAQQADLPDIGNVVSYRTSNWGAVIAAGIIFLIGAILTLVLAGFLLSAIMSPPENAFERSLLGIGYFVVSIPIGFILAKRYAWYPRLTRRSNRRIRSAVRQLFDVY